MADDRYPGTGRDYYRSSNDPDYAREYGTDQTGRYSSARDYAAAGELGGQQRGQQGGRGGNHRSYSGQEYDRQFGDHDRGRQEYRGGSYGGGQQGGREWGGAYGGNYGGGGAHRDWGSGEHHPERNYGGNYGSNYGEGRGQGGGGYGGYGQTDRGRGQEYGGYGRQRDWGNEQNRGSFGQGWGNERGQHMQGPQNRSQSDRSGGSQQGYDPNDRGFFDRAGDEVMSWFGDEDAQRRREMDARQDQQQGGSRGSSNRDEDRHHHDYDYAHWRRNQMESLDRDYHEYRNENRQKFANEFGSWRTERQGQRDCLRRVNEHMDVVGSDGEHVGTVDKVRGDRIILTKSDGDAEGHHHSIPSRWIDSVEDNKVKLRKTANEAHDHWRDEERNTAMFGAGEQTREQQSGSSQSRTGQSGEGNAGSTDLNRSFSGTYSEK